MSILALKKMDFGKFVPSDDFMSRHSLFKVAQLHIDRQPCILWALPVVNAEGVLVRERGGGTKCLT